MENRQNIVGPPDRPPASRQNPTSETTADNSEIFVETSELPHDD